MSSERRRKSSAPGLTVQQAVSMAHQSPAPHRAASTMLSSTDLLLAASVAVESAELSASSPRSRRDSTAGSGSGARLARIHHRLTDEYYTLLEAPGMSVADVLNELARKLGRADGRELSLFAEEHESLLARLHGSDSEEDDDLVMSGGQLGGARLSGSTPSEDFLESAVAGAAGAGASGASSGVTMGTPIATSVSPRSGLPIAAGTAATRSRLRLLDDGDLLVHVRALWGDAHMLNKFWVAPRAPVATTFFNGTGELGKPFWTFPILENTCAADVLRMAAERENSQADQFCLVLERLDGAGGSGSGSGKQRLKTPPPERTVLEPADLVLERVRALERLHNARARFVIDWRAGSRTKLPISSSASSSSSHMRSDARGSAPPASNTSSPSPGPHDTATASERAGGQRSHTTDTLRRASLDGSLSAAAATDAHPRASSSFWRRRSVEAPLTGVVSAPVLPLTSSPLASLAEVEGEGTSSSEASAASLPATTGRQHKADESTLSTRSRSTSGFTRRQPTPAAAVAVAVEPQTPGSTRGQSTSALLRRLPSADAPVSAAAQPSSPEPSRSRSTAMFTRRVPTPGELSPPAAVSPRGAPLLHVESPRSVGANRGQSTSGLLRRLPAPEAPAQPIESEPPRNTSTATYTRRLPAAIESSSSSPALTAQPPHSAGTNRGQSTTALLRRLPAPETPQPLPEPSRSVSTSTFTRRLPAAADPPPAAVAVQPTRSAGANRGQSGSALLRRLPALEAPTPVSASPTVVLTSPSSSPSAAALSRRVSTTVEGQVVKRRLPVSPEKSLTGSLDEAASRGQSGAMFARRKPSGELIYDPKVPVRAASELSLHAPAAPVRLGETRQLSATASRLMSTASFARRRAFDATTETGASDSSVFRTASTADSAADDNTMRARSNSVHGRLQSTGSSVASALTSVTADSSDSPGSLMSHVLTGNDTRAMSTSSLLKRRSNEPGVTRSRSTVSFAPDVAPGDSRAESTRTAFSVASPARRKSFDAAGTAPMVTPRHLLTVADAASRARTGTRKRVKARVKPVDLSSNAAAAAAAAAAVPLVTSDGRTEDEVATLKRVRVDTMRRARVRSVQTRVRATSARPTTVVIVMVGLRADDLVADEAAMAAATHHESSSSPRAPSMRRPLNMMPQFFDPRRRVSDPLPREASRASNSGFVSVADSIEDHGFSSSSRSNSNDGGNQSSSSSSSSDDSGSDDSDDSADDDDDEVTTRRRSSASGDGGSSNGDSSGSGSTAADDAAAVVDVSTSTSSSDERSGGGSGSGSGSSSDSSDSSDDSSSSSSSDSKNSRASGTVISDRIAGIKSGNMGDGSGSTSKGDSDSPAREQAAGRTRFDEPINASGWGSASRNSTVSFHSTATTAPKTSSSSTTTSASQSGRRFSMPGTVVSSISSLASSIDSLAVPPEDEQHLLDEAMWHARWLDAGPERAFNTGYGQSRFSAISMQVDIMPKEHASSVVWSICSALCVPRWSEWALYDGARHIEDFESITLPASLSLRRVGETDDPESDASAAAADAAVMAVINAAGAGDGADAAHQGGSDSRRVSTVSTSESLPRGAQEAAQQVTHLRVMVAELDQELASERQTRARGEATMQRMTIEAKKLKLERDRLLSTIDALATLAQESGAPRHRVDQLLKAVADSVPSEATDDDVAYARARSMSPASSMSSMAAAAAAAAATAASFVIDEDELELLEVLGEGAMATVYYGHYRGQDVAVKVLRSLGDDDEAKRDFWKECQIMSTLRCKETVYFYGATPEPHVALVLEYCSRGSLVDLMQRPRVQWPWALVLRMLAQVTNGLCALHGWKPAIVHRDLKASNLMVDADWKVKIGDFGIARIGDDNDDRLRGTVAYVAPEMFHGATASAAADIYAVGIISWEVFARAISGFYSEPYSDRHLAHNYQILLLAAMQNVRPTMPVGTPEPLRRVAARCWHPLPNERPTAPGLARRFRRLQRNEIAQRNHWANVLFERGLGPAINAGD